MNRVLFGAGLALLSQTVFAIESQIVVSAEKAVFCLDGGGNLKWSFHHPFIYYSNSSPAIGNIDNRLEAEIIVAAVDLYCLNYDGTVRWSFAADTTMCFCCPVIANVDTAGMPEVLIGTTDTLYCLDNNGDRQWAVEIPGNYVRAYLGPSITVANVDGVGMPEVLVATPGWFYCVNGGGTVRWSYDMTGTASNDGFTGIAVADLDMDNVPEIVVTQSDDEFIFGHSSTVYCLRPDGSLKWEITDSSYVSQPAIADIDGDNKPEIVLHFSGRSPKIVAAFRENAAGTGLDLVWETAVVDETPSSVPFPVICDIDGDGDKDVLWVGHINTFSPAGALYVMNGLDGKHPDNSGAPCYTSSDFFSRTVCERGVAIADIDDDGHLEIVGISSDAACVYGVCALECDGSWAGGKNAYTSDLYHITDVEDDLRIPRIESNNWETHNTWATQLSTGGTGFGTPAVKWTYYNSDFARPLSSIAIAPVSHSVGIEEDMTRNADDNRSDRQVRAYYDRGQIKVSFTLSNREDISFRILDVVGRERKNLAVGNMSKGKHQRCLEVGRLENGVYFVQTHIGDETFGSKVIVLR